ncbi:S-layer homology domain-containing protein [Planococcus wigleyi]|uniref:S-layer homology domain-containing protein n=1 Tax=Planococcus wigleyi TaxID=2762216 RepID=A0ABR8WAC3_9BACL|nr:S-layer homology domain-containing protein [Planococcus wigleyi]MBD8013982.1 S-layer homology domain-containing protein [Planococcus wigleyi]
MIKKFFTTTAAVALVLTSVSLTPLAAPQKPEQVKPANYSKDVSLTPTLEAIVKDSTGAGIKTVDFKKGFKYDFAGKGITGFANDSADNPITVPIQTNAAPLTGEQIKAMAADDGKTAVTKSSNGFPSQRFVVDVSKDLAAGNAIQLYWEGKTLASGLANLSAWDYKAGNWVALNQAEGNAKGEEIVLKAEIDKERFVKDGKVQAMVHDSGTLTDSKDEDFSMVWFTDTQYYAQDFPEVWTSMTDWMIDEFKKGTYEYAMHTGDLVNNVIDEEQWKVAEENLDRLDAANIPYGVLAGNHDVGIDTLNKTYDYSIFARYAGIDRFKDKSWFGEAMNEENQNHYDLFSFGDHDFIFLYLGYGRDGSAETVAWANKVLKQHADRNAIVGMHENINSLAQYVTEQARVVNREIVVPNENVKMVLSGHHHGANYRVKQIENEDGSTREVLEVLANHQGNTAPDRGQGYLKKLTFDPTDETLDFVSYSPFENDYDFEQFDPAKESFTAQFDLADVKAKDNPRQIETDYMAVNIYTDQAIGQDKDLKSGEVASAEWKGLSKNTVYHWYMNITNAAGESEKSPIYQFTTGSTAPDPKPDPKPEPTKPTFPDVTPEKPAWAYEAIERMAAEGIIKGHPDGTFKWRDGIQRQHVSLMFDRAVDLENELPYKAFKDVPKSHPNFDAITATQRAGIFEGYNNLFQPKSKLTREEMAKVLVTAFDIEAKGSHNFPDVKKGGWSDKYIDTLYAAGITIGSTNGKFNPKADVTRAEFAVFMDRALKYDETH